MSVSVPSMNSAIGRMAGMAGPLSSPLSGLLGYEASLMVGAPSPPRSSPPAWGCAPVAPVASMASMQVKQEPSDRDHDSSGVSSMTHGSHGSSFLSALSGTNTSPSSSSSAGSPPGHHQHGYHHAATAQSGPPGMAGFHHQGLQQGGLSPRRASPASPARPASDGPAHSTPLSARVGATPASPHQHAADAAPAPAMVPRAPRSVDDNSRSSTSSHSEDDAEEQVRRLRATLEAAHVASGAGSAGSGLQCQLCSFVADSRERLSEHVASHFKCSLCDHAAGTADALRAHLHEAHDLPVPPGLGALGALGLGALGMLSQPSPEAPEAPPSEEGYPEQDQDDDMEGVATPRVNSQGKVKTFRCKQCEFVAVTKLDFWEHTKQHIKQEKMLCCPKCPFVTEYKHHLEYHLRNHFNSKPFKCDKCPYSCVNKSMLNSHLKSHSNVYQYRCADCNYATKYCHSLKLHLRKYGHQPSMVLNPDGTPNPLPIIDVYGTRRGPKNKGSKAALQQQALQHHQQQVQLPPQQFPHAMFPPPYGLPTIFPYAGPAPQDLCAAPNGPAPVPNGPAPAPRQGSPLLHRCNFCELTTPDADALARHMFVHAEAMQNNLMQYFSANNNNYYQDGVKEYLGKAVRPASPPAVPAAPAPAPAQSPPRTPSSPRSGASAPPAAVAPGRPLDLSKPEHSVEEVRETKSRRKGRAFKLERIAMRLQHQSSGDEAEPDQVAAKGPASSPEPKARSPLVSPPSSPVAPQAPQAGASEKVYNCGYCDIGFKDIVMYTMHMGYHGYNDPYQCNMCGEETADKVAFFLHIARSSHT